jgi:hypothetical protein
VIFRGFFQSYWDVLLYSAVASDEGKEGVGMRGFGLLRMDYGGEN